MKKVVIAGSAKLQDDMDNRMQKFTVKKYEILDYPRPIEKEKFLELYPSVHKEFFEILLKPMHYLL